MTSIRQKTLPLKGVVIAWTPNSKLVAVGPLGYDPGLQFECTAGGVYAHVQDMKNDKHLRAYLLDLVLYMVFENGVDPAALGRELKKITEWDAALANLAGGKL